VIQALNSPVEFDSDPVTGSGQAEILTAAMAIPTSARANEATNELADHIARLGRHAQRAVRESEVERFDLIRQSDLEIAVKLPANLQP